MSTTIETLSLQNFSDDNIVEELELSADAASGQKTITVLNPNGAAAGDYLVLVPGEETAEIGQIDTGGVSGNGITFKTNLILNHKAHEKVQKLFGNQIKVYRTANVDGTPPADSAFTALGSPVTIDPDQPFSYYTDSAGGAGYWYKFTYYNSTTSAETDLSLSEAVRGGGFGDYVSLEEIKKEAGLEEARRLDNTQVALRRAAAQSEVKGALAAAGYTMPLQTTNGAGFVPDLIRDITRRLAAGMILQQNFGTVKPGSAKDGKAKCEDARAVLTHIQKNTVVLLDSNEQMLAKPALVSGWPDDTTMDNGQDIGPVMTMDKRF